MFTSANTGAIVLGQYLPNRYTERYISPPGVRRAPESLTLTLKKGSTPSGERFSLPILLNPHLVLNLREITLVTEILRHRASIHPHSVPIRRKPQDTALAAVRLHDPETVI